VHLEVELLAEQTGVASNPTDPGRISRAGRLRIAQRKPVPVVVVAVAVVSAVPDPSLEESSPHAPAIAPSASSAMPEAAAFLR